MDDVDHANQKSDEAIAAAICRSQRALNQRVLQPVGACHWCNEVVGNQKLFCNGECADDHAALMRRENKSCN